MKRQRIVVRRVAAFVLAFTIIFSQHAYAASVSDLTPAPGFVASTLAGVFQQWNAVAAELESLVHQLALGIKGPSASILTASLANITDPFFGATTVTQPRADTSTTLSPIPSVVTTMPP